VTEFTLIDRHCQDIGAVHPETLIGVGDDAAVVRIPDGMELAISVDTMVEGVHFFADVNPAHLAHKLLAVNISDMAAMGAEPKWATLALTLPSENTQWLSAFSESLDTTAKRFGVQLIGGDTTQGNLTLSLQIIGLLPKSKALSRSKAQPGDDVYVSNTVGDAALALACLEQGKDFQGLNKTRLLEALELPEPQVSVGRALLNYASACIDISDGLVADLSHIAKSSKVSIKLDVDLIPLSDDYQTYVSHGGDLDLALTGGDDYQLGFTVPSEHAKYIQALAQSLGVSLTNIGVVIASSDQPVYLRSAGADYQLASSSGYQHFGEY